MGSVPDHEHHSQARHDRSAGAGSCFRFAKKHHGAQQKEVRLFPVQILLISLVTRDVNFSAYDLGISLYLLFISSAAG